MPGGPSCHPRPALPCPVSGWQHQIRGNRRHRVGGVSLAVLDDVTDRTLADTELSRYREHLEEVVSTRTAELVASSRRLEKRSLRWPMRVSVSSGSTRKTVASFT
jgi:hypothetical protein